MSAPIEPPELAALVDAAERSRAEHWSLRAALTRYAQPEPQRASAVIELLRRTEAALKPHAKRLERDGPALWSAVAGGVDGTVADDDRFVVEVLRALVGLDRLADVLVAWAVERAGERPDGAVDDVVADVTARFERLGVGREERPAPPGRAGSRRR